MVNSVTTKKGTVLPLLNLKGKEYLQVAHRLIWFREEHPTGEIRTELVETNDNHSIFKATIVIEGKILATAHQREDKVDFKDHLAKSETAAIGRALALCGYGTQFAQELEEEHRIVDAPQAKPLSFKEGLGTYAGPLVYCNGTVTPQTKTTIKQAPTKPPVLSPEETRANDLAGLFKSKGWTKQQAKEYITKAYKTDSLKNLTLDQCKAFHDVLTNSVNANVALSKLDLAATPKTEPKGSFETFNLQPTITEDDVPF